MNEVFNEGNERPRDEGTFSDGFYACLFILKNAKLHFGIEEIVQSKRVRNCFLLAISDAVTFKKKKEKKD